ncbi:hypothetical protein IPZ58_28690 [Streptomyces roseoverticillatus]|uniref:hypothetical protein n=1 Tax=Streptomyces roseoverticillatus TaxID=66429 RepID=UPI001F421C29|nr:hypothetical protein [Streptomyces roseoverticillatus]MCF3105540.1 hypothetical protein [Streptomyces roseoverticillatus]
MTPRTPESRRRQAVTLVEQVAEIVYREGRRYPAFFYLTLLETRDILADPEESDAETALTDAAARFKKLYASPRDNFSEFYVHSDDPQQRVAENGKFSELVNELRSTLHDS